jgi:hypothetical protein
MQQEDHLAAPGRTPGAPNIPPRRPRQAPRSFFQRLLEKLGLRRKGRKKKNDPNIYPLY